MWLKTARKEAREMWQQLVVLQLRKSLHLFLLPWSMRTM